MISILLILYNFSANLSNDIYLPSMPQLATFFKTDANTLQFTMTVWFLGVAMPQLFFGPLTDRFGRRPVLLGGGICFLIATFICLIANHIGMLIVGRFFQGVGVCSLNVTTFSILVDLFDYKKRNQVMNKISLFGTLAPLVGPVIGGYVSILFGWRFNFLIVLVLSMAGIIGLFFKLPESNLYLNPHALHVRNMVKNYYLLLKTPGFFPNLMTYCLLLGGLVAYLTAAPFIIITQLKIHTESFGFTQLPVFSAYVLGSIFLNRAKDEESIKKILNKGIYCSLLGSAFLLICSFLFGNHLFYFITAMTIYAFGLSLCSSPLVNEVMSSAIVSKGSAAAVLGCGMALSCAFSSMFLSLIYDGTVFSLATLLFMNAFLSMCCYVYKTLFKFALTNP